MTGFNAGRVTSSPIEVSPRPISIAMRILVHHRSHSSIVRPQVGHGTQVRQRTPLNGYPHTGNGSASWANPAGGSLPSWDHFSWRSGATRARAVSSRERRQGPNQAAISAHVSRTSHALGAAGSPRRAWAMPSLSGPATSRGFWMRRCPHNALLLGLAA